MSRPKRRRQHRPRIDVFLQVPVDDLAAARARLATLTRCASCRGPIRIVGATGFHVEHIGDCPALTDPARLLPPTSN